MGSQLPFKGLPVAISLLISIKGGGEVAGIDEITGHGAVIEGNGGTAGNVYITVIFKIGGTIRCHTIGANIGHFQFNTILTGADSTLIIKSTAYFNAMGWWRLFSLHQGDWASLRIRIFSGQHNATVCHSKIAGVDKILSDSALFNQETMVDGVNISAVVQAGFDIHIIEIKTITITDAFSIFRCLGGEVTTIDQAAFDHHITIIFAIQLKGIVAAGDGAGVDHIALDINVIQINTVVVTGNQCAGVDQVTLDSTVFNNDGVRIGVDGCAFSIDHTSFDYTVVNLDTFGTTDTHVAEVDNTALHLAVPQRKAVIAAILIGDGQGAIILNIAIDDGVTNINGRTLFSGDITLIDKVFAQFNAPQFNAVTSCVDIATIDKITTNGDQAITRKNAIVVQIGVTIQINTGCISENITAIGEVTTNGNVILKQDTVIGH